MKKALIALIEREDGSCFKQELEFINGDVELSIKKAQKCLGKDYLICNWWISERF